MNEEDTFRLYATSPYPCGYLDGYTARSKVIEPSHLVDSFIYTKLISEGYRRNGSLVYKPYCDNCQKCIPVRIKVDDFQYSRSQLRIFKKCESLVVEEYGLHFKQEHYDLYKKYQKGRHKGGGMDTDEEADYIDYLLTSNVDTSLITFTDTTDDKLSMVSIIDVLYDGLSAVYTFFDPDKSSLSLGTFGVLWQIQVAKNIGKKYVYLGYWIKECPKMAYKIKFTPLEGFINGKWQKL